MTRMFVYTNCVPKLNEHEVTSSMHYKSSLVSRYKVTVFWWHFHNSSRSGLSRNMRFLVNLWMVANIIGYIWFWLDWTHLIGWFCRNIHFHCWRLPSSRVDPSLHVGSAVHWLPCWYGYLSCSGERLVLHLCSRCTNENSLYSPFFLSFHGIVPFWRYPNALSLFQLW